MHDLPKEMTVVEITAPGGPDMLRPAARPVPSPGPGDVLIVVEAAGINRPDVFQRRGDYPPPPGASDLPGLEVAGRVVAVGEGVVSPVVGERVCALTPGGGYAEYCLTPAAHCLPVPDGLTMVEAAGLPETLFTVWSNVFERGRLVAGETLLVHGGASGIGTTAIQLARALGAKVFVTAGSDGKCAACRAIGADLAINYRTTDYVEEVKAATGGGGVDVILDMVGGSYFERNLRCLAEDGRHVTIAALEGAKVALNLNVLSRRRFTVTGSTLRPQSASSKARIAGALREIVWPLIDARKIRPIVHATFPLARASEAHAMMEAGDHIGKIILTVADGGAGPSRPA